MLSFFFFLNIASLIRSKTTIIWEQQNKLIVHRSNCYILPQNNFVRFNWFDWILTVFVRYLDGKVLFKSTTIGWDAKVFFNPLAKYFATCPTLWYILPGPQWSLFEAVVDSTNNRHLSEIIFYLQFLWNDWLLQILTNVQCPTVDVTTHVQIPRVPSDVLADPVIPYTQT